MVAADDADPALRANALEGLALVPRRSEPIIARALRDPNEGVRAVAAMVVGRAGLTTVSGSLRPLLEDRSPYVRASAIFGMAKTVGGADPSPLAAMLLSDPSPRIRSHAVFILGDLGDPSALPMIRESVRLTIPRASESESKLFQLQAAEAMVKLGDADRLEVILAALFAATQDDLQIAALAAQILGGLGYKSVINDLKNLAGEIDNSGRTMPPEIRMAAAGALAELTRTGDRVDVGFIADEYRAAESPLVRMQAAFVYGQNRGPNDLVKLDAMLSDQSGLVRVSAAAAILKFAPDR
ncbi:MAG: HEAT repeat domain-containing protein [Phycisphaerales bacterium]